MVKKNNIFWVVFLLVLLTLIFIVSLNLGYFNSLISKYIGIYGYYALFILSLLSDSFDQPIGPDAVAVAGYLLGLNLLSVFIICVAATWIMDLISYYLGRTIFSEKIKAACSTKRHANHCKFFFKYGKFALFLGGLTPIPEVFIIWLSGAFHMKLRDFFLFGMLAKAFRIGIVLLIVAGIFRI